MRRRGGSKRVESRVRGKLEPEDYGSAEKTGEGALTPAESKALADYVARTKSYLEAHGEGFVVRAIEGEKGSAATREPATEAEFIAWVAYYGRLEIPCVFMQQYGMSTTPARWPEEFDRSCPSSDRRAVIPRGGGYRRRGLG